MAAMVVNSHGDINLVADTIALSASGAPARQWTLESGPLTAWLASDLA